MNKKGKYLKIASFFTYIFGITFIFLGILFIEIISVKVLKGEYLNNNLFKTVSTKELMNCFQNISKDDLTPVMYNEFSDAVYNSKYYPTSFVGVLEHYTLDCPRCNNTLSCNGQNIKEDSIYYNDPEYGKIRIVASNSVLPCGSIVKMNYNSYENIYAIALDKKTEEDTISLLEDKVDMKFFDRVKNDVVFTILRYGY